MNNRKFLISSAICLLILSGRDAAADNNKPSMDTVEFLQPLATQGNATAQVRLGDLYYAGKGIPVDHQRAIEWYKKAAEQGDKYGAERLGDVYFDGRDVPQNSTEAFKWYRRAAEAGLPPAQVHTGYFYSRGIGVEKDEREAVKWYTLAAKQGVPEAEFNLGVAYEKGNGVAQNFNEAAKWFKSASDHGLTQAKDHLGFLYEKGQGVAQNTQEADKLFHEAAGQGNKDAAIHRELYRTAGTPEFSDRLRVIRASADGGNPKAAILLGQMYEFPGPTQDYQEAYFWLSIAAKSDPDQATSRDEAGKLLTAQQIQFVQKRVGEWQAYIPPGGRAVWHSRSEGDKVILHTTEDPDPRHRADMSFEEFSKISRDHQERYIKDLDGRRRILESRLRTPMYNQGGSLYAASSTLALLKLAGQIAGYYAMMGDFDNAEKELAKIDRRHFEQIIKTSRVVGLDPKDPRGAIHSASINYGIENFDISNADEIVNLLTAIRAGNVEFSNKISAFFDALFEITARKLEAGDTAYVKAAKTLAERVFLNGALPRMPREDRSQLYDRFRGKNTAVSLFYALNGDNEKIDALLGGLDSAEADNVRLSAVRGFSVRKDFDNAETYLSKMADGPEIIRAYGYLLDGLSKAHQDEKLKIEISELLRVSKGYPFDQGAEAKKEAAKYLFAMGKPDEATEIMRSAMIELRDAHYFCDENFSRISQGLGRDTYCPIFHPQRELEDLSIRYESGASARELMTLPEDSSVAVRFTRNGRFVEALRYLGVPDTRIKQPDLSTVSEVLFYLALSEDRNKYRSEYEKMGAALDEALKLPGVTTSVRSSVGARLAAARYKFEPEKFPNIEVEKILLPLRLNLDPRRLPPELKNVALIFREANLPTYRDQVWDDYRRASKTVQTTLPQELVKDGHLADAENAMLDIIDQSRFVLISRYQENIGGPRERAVLRIASKMAETKAYEPAVERVEKIQTPGLQQEAYFQIAYAMIYNGDKDSAKKLIKARIRSAVNPADVFQSLLMGDRFNNDYADINERVSWLLNRILVLHQLSESKDVETCVGVLRDIAGQIDQPEEREALVAQINQSLKKIGLRTKPFE